MDRRSNHHIVLRSIIFLTGDWVVVVAFAPRHANLGEGPRATIVIPSCAHHISPFLLSLLAPSAPQLLLSFLLDVRDTACGGGDPYPIPS